MAVITFFTLLFSYAILGFICWKQDTVFSHIILCLYSMLSATLVMTTIATFTTETGVSEVLGGAWLISVCFIFTGFISITRIFKNRRRS